MAGITATYVSPSGFTIETDRTDEFITDRRIKANCGIDGYKFGTITSSSYSNPDTTVNLTITSDDLTSNLTEVHYGIVSEGTSGSVPIHNHNGDEGSGGGISQLVASDGSPDPALSIDADGKATLNAGQITISNPAPSGNNTIKVGYGSTGNRHAYIDLIGDDTYTDYGLRITRNNSGPNSSAYIYHKGTGTFNIVTQEEAYIRLSTNSVLRLSIASNGLVSLMNGTGINEFSTDDTLAGDSDDAVPTEQAVKAYVDNKFYLHTQSASAASTWTVNHNLDFKYVNVEIIIDDKSIAGTYDYPEIEFITNNQLTCTFTEATTGYCHCVGGN